MKSQDNKMNKFKPLTNKEKLILKENGWEFLNENYIYIPDDYDGCMAYGIRNIRCVLEDIQKRIQAKELLKGL